MSTSHAIIAACTRDGVTSWQNVARQLGRSVASVRAEFDPNYLHSRPCPQPCEEVEPELEPTDLSSPYKREPVACRILRVLQDGPRCADTIATRLQQPVNAVRARLSELRRDGLVTNDAENPRRNGRFEWTWSLTAKGLRKAVTACAEEAKERA